MRRVILIDGIYTYVEDALAQLVRIMTATGTLSDFPDSPEKENALKLLKKMDESDMLSEKMSALIGLHEANKKLEKFTIEEG